MIRRCGILAVMLGGLWLGGGAAEAMPVERMEPGAQAFEGLVVKVCGKRCRQNRHISRHQSRRRHHKHHHHRPGRRPIIVHEHRRDRGGRAAVGLAAGFIGLAVGAAIANSATNNVGGDYPR